MSDPVSVKITETQRARELIALQHNQTQSESSVNTCGSNKHNQKEVAQMTMETFSGNTKKR